MNCEEATKLMDGYLDGELDPITSQTIEQHLRDCPNCEQKYMANRALVNAIGSAIPYYKAPAGLRERIQCSLREEIADRPARAVPRLLVTRKQPEPRTTLFGTPWNWLSLGGRLDYLDNRTVAALIYQRRKHFINVFVWPREAAARPALAMSHQGYQLLHWADPDFNYWAVSDASASDLQTFKQQFEAQRSHH